MLPVREGEDNTTGLHGTSRQQANQRQKKWMPRNESILLKHECKRRGAKGMQGEGYERTVDREKAREAEPARCGRSLLRERRKGGGLYRNATRPETG